MDGNHTGPHSSSCVIAAAAAVGVCYLLLRRLELESSAVGHMCYGRDLDCCHEWSS